MNNLNKYLPLTFIQVKIKLTLFVDHLMEFLTSCEVLTEEFYNFLVAGDVLACCHQDCFI